MSEEKQVNNNNEDGDETSSATMAARVPVPVKQRKTKRSVTSTITDPTIINTSGTMTLTEKMLFKNKLAFSLSNKTPTVQNADSKTIGSGEFNLESPGIKIEIRSPSLNIPLAGLVSNSRNDMDQQETPTTPTPTTTTSQDSRPPIKPRALARRQTLAESTTSNVQDQAILETKQSANSSNSSNDSDQLVSTTKRSNSPQIDTSNLNNTNNTSGSSKQSIFNRALAFIPFTSSNSDKKLEDKKLPDIPPPPPNSVYVKSENKSSVKLKKSNNRLSREKRSNSIIDNSAMNTDTVDSVIIKTAAEAATKIKLLRTESLDRFDSASTNRSSSSSNRSSGFVDIEQPLSSNVPSEESKQRKSTDSKKLKKSSSTHKMALAAAAAANEDSVGKSDETAYEKLANHFGSEVSKLICDNTSRLNRLNTGGNIAMIEEQHRHRAQSIQHANNRDEINLKKKQKLDEYSNIEKKQAKLLTILYNNIYTKLNEENGHHQRLAETEEFQKLFYPVVELQKLATLVHEQVGNEIKSRIDSMDEWSEKPFVGDILIKYYQYYKIYRCVLERYPAGQLTLSNLLKKKNFAASLKKYLDAEAENLDNVNRLDMLLDRVVDFPRRCKLFHESYLELVDFNSKEYENIKKVYTLFTQIFESSNSALDNMNNFQLCYELQYMFEPPLLNIVDQNRRLIKQGPVFKVAKRSGHFLLRHLALFTDMLLVCKTDRMRRKLVVNYLIQASEIRSVVISSDQEPLFRIVSNDQNNEFRADKMKHREEWIAAFGLSGIRIDAKSEQSDLNKIRKVGIEPPPWVPDSLQEECSGCKESFSAFKRRHHCRTCGRIFCNNCSNFYVPVQFTQFKEKVRVCRNCYNLLEKVYQDHLLGGGGGVRGSNGLLDAANNTAVMTPAPSKNNIISQSTSLLSSHFPTGFNGVLKNITDTFSSGIGTSSAKTSTPSVNVKFSKNNKRLSGIISDMNVSTQQVVSDESRRKSDTGSLTSNTDDPCHEALKGDDDSTSQSTSNNLITQTAFVASDDIDSEEDEDENSSVDENQIGAESFRNPPDLFHIKSPNSIDFGSVLSLENVNLNLNSSSVGNETTNTTSSSVNVSSSSSSHQTSGVTEKSDENISNETTESGGAATTNESTSSEESRGLTKSSVSYTSLLNVSRASKFSSQSTRDVLHAEYGYLCKIQVKSKSQEEETSDAINEETKKKWERTYLVLYSDHMIGSCQSNHDTSKPNLLIKLSRYELKSIDETTFSLEVENNSNEQTTEQIESIKSTNDSLESSVKIASFRNKRKMFEFNFEFKFTNKDSKNKWYELLTSLKEQRDL